MTIPELKFPPYQFDLFDYNQLLLPFPRKRNLKDFEAIAFKDGRSIYKYQAENVDFALNKALYGDKVRCMIADDTGLGKTISSIGIMLELDQYPVLIVCMATLKIQYLIELFGTTHQLGQILFSNKIAPNPESQIYIISYDLLKKYKFRDQLNPRLIVIDECQKIKNWESDRTQELVGFCASHSDSHIIMTSATPIENNAYEFFPTFHILRPDRFTNRSQFANVCEYIRIGNGFKLGGISLSYMNWFKRMTEDVVIRHRRKDVYKELPTERIRHRFIKIEEEKPLEAIKREMESYLDLFDRVSEYDSENEDEDKNELNMKLQASFMRIRHLVGDAKVPYILEDVEEFLESYEGARKLTLFVHHKSVADSLLTGIEKIKDKFKINSPFLIRGGMNELERNKLVGACTSNRGWPSNDERDRILIGSTLACGIGINLQKCYDAKLCERQFNPPKEEQAAPGRFARPGSELLTDSIFIDIYTALDTIDEYLNQLVESKRGGFHRSMGDDEGETSFDEQTLVKQLMTKLAEEGRKWIKKGF